MPTEEDRHALRFGLSAYVYDPETLARTATLLDRPEYRTWRMPDVCRTLITALYDQPEGYWSAERLGCDGERLEAVRTRARRLRDQMDQAAMSGQMPAPDVADLLAMKNPRRDASDDGARVLLTTRYGGHSATVSLFRQTGGGVQTAGQEGRTAL